MELLNIYIRIFVSVLFVVQSCCIARREDETRLEGYA